MVICILLILGGIFTLLVAGASISIKEFEWYKNSVSEGTKTILMYAPLIGVIVYLLGIVLIYK